MNSVWFWFRLHCRSQVRHSYLWSPVFALVIAFDAPKSRLFMWSVRGGSIPFPSDDRHLIWYWSSAKLGSVQRGPDLLVFVLRSIAVLMAASGRCLVHYCICFCGVCSESTVNSNSQQGTIEWNCRGAAVCFVWLHSWCGALLSKFAHIRTSCPLFSALFSL